MNHDDLIHRFLDGTASQAEAAELSQLIETDANMRNRYLDLSELHAVLSAEESLRAPRAEKVIARPKWVRFAPALKIAAVLVLVGLAFWWLKPAVQPDLPFATLISTVNARWENEATELNLNAGEAPSGMLRLLEGEAEFATSQGATVALEAPAVIAGDAGDRSRHGILRGGSWRPQHARGRFQRRGQSGLHRAA
jgi:hypothetical protein